MAQLSNTHDRYDLDTTGINVIRDVDKMIYNIDPEETPFTSNIGSGSADSTYKEWLVDSYAAPDTANKKIDGDEFTNDALDSAEVLGDYLQISWKVLETTRRADAVGKYGRSGEEMTYQLLKKGVELKRDVEAIACGYGGHQAAAAGNSTTAPTSASLGSWLRTNVDRGATGASPTLSSTTYGYPNAAPTDGAVRALSQATLLSVVTSIYNNSRKPDMIMVDPTMKTRLSTYLFGSGSRVATPYMPLSEGSKKAATMVGAVDVYVTDFGVLDVVPSRFQRGRDVFILNSKDFRIDFLTKFKTGEIAKTGDAQRKSIIADWTLVSKNEKGSGIVADIDTTAAVTA